MGYDRVGAGMVIQQERGLRPSEMLRLLREHVVLPTGDGMASSSIVLNLGMCSGTKLKTTSSARFVDRSPALFLLAVHAGTFHTEGS